MTPIVFDPKTTFFLLDFDRTLANTDALREELEHTITTVLNISMEFLDAERHKIEGSGESFDMIKYLREYLAKTDSGESWFTVQRAFIREARQKDMLEPYAKELLSLLDERQLPYGIITYGGEAWQLAKMEAADLLDIPHLITHIKKKGEILSGWKQDDGMFIVPPMLSKDFQPRSVKTLVFIDDKPISFVGIPQGVIGIQVQSVKSVETNQASIPLNPHAQRVQGLKEAIELIFPHNIDKA